MATYSSEFITDKENLDIQNIQQRAGREEALATTIALAGVVADNEVIVMTEIPVNANITSIKMWSDDLGTTGDLNLGFYPGNITPSTLVVGDAIDEDALATAIDVNAAATADVEVRFEVKDHNTTGDLAWELAGLSAEPAYGTFFICFTASEATTAAGDISLVVRHIV
jgi:hypothetical protein